MVGARDRHDTAYEADRETRFRIEAVLGLRCHPYAGEHQERAEQVDDPVELLDQVCAGCDHGAAHEQRTENSPEQDAVLITGWNAEEAEDQDEDENVIDRKRLLDQIAGEVLQPGIATHEAVDADAEQQR
jgi:hypothetical protein